MRSLPFKQVDVFTSRRFAGNPVAVIMDGSALSTAQMQTIARWTNLSETTFVVPTQLPEADYHVRIFTPHSELPFAGHPTIGTAHALLEAGLVQTHDGQLHQQCGAGLIHLNIASNIPAERLIAFELPAPNLTALSSADVDALESSVRVRIDRALTPLLIDVGPRWSSRESSP